MKNTLIIIDHEPYTSRKRDHYFLEDFRSIGFNVEYWSAWSLFPYIKKGIYHHVEKAEGVVYFTSLDHLIQRVKNLDKKNTVLCLEVALYWTTKRLFHAIKKKKLTCIRLEYYLFDYTSLSVSDQRSSFLKNYLSKTRRYLSYALNLGKPQIKRTFLSRLYYWYVFFFFKNHLVNATFIGGSARLKSNVESLLYSEKVFSISHFDVISFDRAKEKERLVDYQYIVFLDIYLPHHPDIFNDNMRSIDAKKYYNKINHAFDKIEKQTGFKIIIAAHPKSQYTNEFGTRACIYGKTAELVLHSEFVLDQCSKSINFAILSRKKVFTVYFDEFKISNDYTRELYLRIMERSRMTGLETLNLDAEFDLSHPMQIDQKVYMEYEKKYLLAESYPESNFEIVKNGILDRFQNTKNSMSQNAE